MLGFQVTLTNADTNYNLLTLVRAISATFADVGDMVIQAHDDGGAQKIKVGGSDLDNTHFGQELLVGDFTPHYRSLRGVNARSDVAGAKLNITVAR